MKRPLAVICIMGIIFLSVLQAVLGSEEDRMLLQTEQILLENAEESMHITVSGTVNACSSLSSGFRLNLDHITVFPTDREEFSLLPDTQIVVTTEDETIFPGDQLLVCGKLSFWEHASNPGTFDAREYYFGKDIVCSLENAEMTQYRAGEVSILRGVCILRRILERSFYKVLDSKAAGTIAAICLGEKSGMDTEWKDVFQEGGIAHILAVSGLHITLIGSGIYQILRRIGCSFMSASISSGSTVLLYAAMTGFSVSAVRAVIMFLVWLGAQIFGRKYDMLTSVSIAAVILTVTDSSILRDASFLLSFSAILVLALLVPAVQSSCMIQNKVVQNISSGILIWIGTLPVTLYFFYQTAPWSFLLNLIVIPLMSVIMLCGIGAAAAGCFHTSLGIFIGAPVYYLLHFFQWLCQQEKKLPQAIWITGRPDGWKICLFYLVLGSCMFISHRHAGEKIRFKCSCKTCADNQNKEENRTVSRRRAVRNRGIWCLGLAVCISLMRPEAPNELRITCLDVGQGDGAVLQMPGGEVFLVDGGSSSERQVWKYQIEKTLKYYGISHIDGVFLSHEDQDHISGIEEFLQDYTTVWGEKNIQGITLKCLYLPPAAEKDAYSGLKTKAARAGIEVCTVAKGSRIESGQDGWSISCLSPDPLDISGDRNEDSMVLMVSYGNFQMLFTGDLEGGAEKKLVLSDTELEADVLKVGHHGSANGSSEEFLRAVTPEAAVISCGKNNRYGHPAEETLQRLRKIKSRYMSTAEGGAIQIQSDGKRYSVTGILSDTR